MQRLPRARVVDRVGFLRRVAKGKRVIHVGFTDEGLQDYKAELGTWLHSVLAREASTLVGIDLDLAGVERARQEGYEAYAADCREPGVLERLGVGRADVVIAGEVIEHVDEAGSFLDGMHNLIAPGGALVVTTPNAYSILNPAAAIGRYEISHPDHVAIYSWYTLTNLLSRHGWAVTQFLTYLLQPIPGIPRLWARRRVDIVLARLIRGVQGILARNGAHFVADGLIAVCRERIH